jgi:hypothetical protein
MDEFPSNFTFYKIPFRPAARILSIKSSNGYFKKIERLSKQDVVFTTSGPAYWKPRSPHLCGFNIAHLVYPESRYFGLIPFWQRFKWTVNRHIKRYFFKRDGKIYVVQTDDINSRLRFWLKTERVYTVSNTCNEYYLNSVNYPKKLPGRFPNEYRLLTFSTFRLHKNLEIIKRIIQIWPEKCSSRIRFVLTIPISDYKSFFNDAERKYIYNAGPVRINEGPSLYKECDASFLPSILECFSAVYPESMAMEKPILTSDLSFARSICQESALYFDPMEPRDALGKICALINSPDLRSELIVKGKKRLAEFGSSSDRARRYLDLCKMAISE